MTSMMGHNGPPADRTFKKRWARALFSVDRKPYGAIAMAFKLYTEMDSQGRGATISDDEFRDSCGVSDGSCRVFKKWLVENEFIRIEVRGQRGRKSTFQAVIPGEIPAASDAIQNEIPAPNTGSFEEYRQPSPAVETGIPATADGINRPAAYSAAIPASCAPAYLESSLREDSYTLQVVSEVEEGADAPSARDALDAFNAYNELAQRVGLPVAQRLSPERRKRIIKRLRDNDGMASWVSLLSNIERSAFLQGDNDRGWRVPGLDWLLKPDNFTKVIEGSYGNGAHAQPKETELERMQRLMTGGEPIDQGRLLP
jgi:hypothetical protein